MIAKGDWLIFEAARMREETLINYHDHKEASQNTCMPLQVDNPLGAHAWAIQCQALK